jgi:hypothetical protein
MSKPYDFLSSL